MYDLCVLIQIKALGIPDTSVETILATVAKFLLLGVAREAATGITSVTCVHSKLRYLRSRDPAPTTSGSVKER